MIGIAAIAVLGGLALIFGLLLGYAGVRFKVEGEPIVELIHNVLPQQQCGKCSYPGCRPYAEAIAKGEAEINQCPPGGETTMYALANLLDRELKPLSAEYSVEQAKMLAVIDESICIGCTLCIQACPVDAILGAPKQMHTVIAQECTGCELCIAPCPVDCIKMVPIPQNVKTWRWAYPGLPTTIVQGTPCISEYTRSQTGEMPSFLKKLGF
jgi:electron transport complex protein RnfB